MKENHIREVSVQFKYLDENGHELPNPTPVAPPIGYQKQESIADMIRRQVRMASEEAKRSGFDSEEEANDFRTGDPFDDEPDSPYEDDFDLDPVLEHMIALQSSPPAPAQPAPPQPAPSPPQAPQQAPEPAK